MDAFESSKPNVTDLPESLKSFLSNRQSAFWLFVILFTPLYILGILSNLFVVISFFVMKSLRTPQNLFVCSLCLTDLVLAALNGVMLSINYLSDEVLVYSGMVCVGTPIILQSGCYVNMNSIIYIAMVRYISVLYPEKKAKYVTWKVLAPVCILMWCLMPIVYAILLSAGTVRVIFKPVSRICNFDYTFSKWYNYATVVIVSVVVLNVLFAYLHIFIFFRRSKRRISGYISADEKKAKRNLKEEIRVAVPMAAIFISFCLAWFPYIIVDQFIDPTEENLPWLHVVTGQFVILDTVLDPVIFIVFNKTFKQEFQRIFGKKSIQRGPQTSETEQH